MEVKKLLSLGCGGYLALCIICFVLWKMFSLFSSNEESKYESSSLYEQSYSETRKETKPKKNYSSYKEACDDEEFDAAYILLDKMKNEYEDFKKNNQLVITNRYMVTHMFSKDEVKYEYDTSNKEKYESMVDSYLSGLEYVYNTEFRFLIAKEDAAENEEVIKRIKYLISEFGSHLNSVITYDDGFEDKAVNMYFSSMESLWKNLISINSDDANKLVLSSLKNGITIRGLRLEEGTKVFEGYSESKNDKEYQIYKTSVSRFNTLCDNLLEHAIIEKNGDFAQMILFQYLDDTDVSNRKKEKFVHYTQTSKRNAQKKYDNAKRMKIIK